MFRRLITLVKSWFGLGLDKLENPDILLDQAKRDMEEIHARNRERAVQAITQKNNLQQMVDDLQKKVDNLQAKAELALKRGDRDVALQLLKEKQSYEVSLTSTRTSLEKAVETAEVVKQHIQREQEEIRKKTAETLALKSQWKSAQIQNEIEKQLSGFREMEDMNSTFARAQEKIPQRLQRGQRPRRTRQDQRRGQDREAGDGRNRRRRRERTFPARSQARPRFRAFAHRHRDRRDERSGEAARRTGSQGRRRRRVELSVCRLLGLAAPPGSDPAGPLPSWEHLVGAPYSLLRQASSGAVPPGAEPGHEDSWGIGWFDREGRVSLLRQTGSAARSAYYVFASEAAARSAAGSGPASVLIGHLRKASVGGVTSENAHPIRIDPSPGEAGETLLLAHNGTLRPAFLETLRADLRDADRERGARRQRHGRAGGVAVGAGGTDRGPW